MVRDTINTVQLRQHFRNKTVFETQDILAFYEQRDNSPSPATLNWRVYSLVQEGVLQRIGRGKFTLGEERKYIPEISPALKSIFKRLKTEFPYVNICIWNTSSLNELMQHQSNQFFTLVETDKDTTNSMFYFLREIEKSVFIEPTSDILERYIVNEKEVFIIKALISEAPTQNINGVETLTVEKMLVDIFCDEVIFFAQQGSELRTIFKNAFEKYTINQSKMLRYADRRGKKEELNQYVKSVSNLWQ